MRRCPSNPRHKEINIENDRRFEVEVGIGWYPVAGIRYKECAAASESEIEVFACACARKRA